MKRVDTDFNKKTATFRDTKNGEDRKIALSDKVIDILKQYPFGDTFFRVGSYDSYNFYFKFRYLYKVIAIAIARLYIIYSIIYNAYMLIVISIVIATGL